MNNYQGTAGSSTVLCGLVQGDPYRVFICLVNEGSFPYCKVICDFGLGAKLTLGKRAFLPQRLVPRVKNSHLHHKSLFKNVGCWSAR